MSYLALIVITTIEVRWTIVNCFEKQALQSLDAERFSYIIALYHYLINRNIYSTAIPMTLYVLPSWMMRS